MISYIRQVNCVRSRGPFFPPLLRKHTTIDRKSFVNYYSALPKLFKLINLTNMYIFVVFNTACLAKLVMNTDRIYLISYSRT